MREEHRAQAVHRDRLQDRHGLKVIVPEIRDRQIVHRINYGGTGETKDECQYDQEDCLHRGAA